MLVRRSLNSWRTVVCRRRMCGRRRGVYARSEPHQLCTGGTTGVQGLWNSTLAKFHKALSEKMDNHNMKSVAKMTAVSEQDLAMECRILPDKTIPDDLSTQQFLVKLAHHTMFPTLSDIAKKYAAASDWDRQH